MSTPERELTRDHFDLVTRVTTRWSDNDMFGHLNNAVYYELFDTAINAWIIEETGLDMVTMPELGVVAESGCKYFTEVEFPGALDVGVRVARLGNSSITYQLGLFAAGRDEIAALGHWVHVYISRETRRPVPIPSGIREVMEQ
ncbi:acyl-CoA thioesterase [Smaragdicoccus niigatensis]|uniref:acyl-CoA thioesterase n=1 Tax=Smaragdicoccus niigatensis TaxID=359359 RepID=UPI00036218DC|nr:thioesterase family protein [Smaragdicoccus niigatensis]